MTLTRLRLLTLLALVLAPACDFEGDGSGGDGDGGDQAGADAGPSVDTPTYYRDVYPILQTRCAGCHTADGIAPFSVDEDPVTAQAWAPQIAAATAGRIMPPYLPGELSPPLRDDAEMRLTDDEIRILGEWAAALAPLGDEADKVPVEPPPGFPLENPDLDFDTGVDYVPDESITDDYRCFAAPIDVTERRMSIGYRITPGSTSVVHHVIVSLVPAANLADLRALDAETPDRSGWPCFGGPVPVGSQIPIVGRLGSWTPGQDGRLTYPGTGTRVPAGVAAIVSVHYNTIHGVEPDRTRVEVFFEPVATQGDLLPLGGLGTVTRDIFIPAGESEVSLSTTRSVATWRDGDAGSAAAGWVVGASAHAHLLMTRFRLTLGAGTAGERILLDIPRWNFHWQGQWLYQEPIEVSPTDMLTIECVYDNSPEHRAAVGLDTRSVDVTWGEGTTDEMCMGGLALLASEPAE